MEKKITISKELYDINSRFFANEKIIEYTNQNQNFYNGIQYPLENYKNMIRIVENICKMDVDIKTSKVCGTPIYLAFTADNQHTNCTALREFDEYNCKKLHMDAHKKQAATNGFVNGTEITFVRWDPDDISYKGIYKGGLVLEHIDIRNFAVANPYIQDIQNQEWVMFWEDYPVESVRAMVEGKNEAEKKKKMELIIPEDANGNPEDYKRPELINSGLVRMYTRFFRVKGDVYFMCSTETIDLFNYPHPLSKQTSKSIIKEIVEDYKKKVKKGDLEDETSKVVDYDIDYENIVNCSVSAEQITKKAYGKIKEKFSLYPFAIFRPSPRNRSFYGKSEIEGLIPAQKVVNYCLSMLAKCAENNAYSKIIVKPDALQGQEITNEPGQVIVDYTQFSNTPGIKALESQPMPNGLFDYVNGLISLTRLVNGFNEVMDGSVTNKDMSGYMLQQMIKQSNTSIEQIQKLFWIYYEDLAHIRLMFYKHYVDEAKYTIELSDSEFEGEEQARIQMYNKLKNGGESAAFPEAKADDFKNPTHKIQVKNYQVNKEIWGVNFDISIDAMQGVADSQLIESQMFDNLFMNGGIDKIDPETLAMYLSANPNVSPRFRVAVKQIIENKKNSQITMLTQELGNATQEIQKLMDYCKQLEALTGRQKSYLDALKSEYSEKINAQNKVIDALVKDRDTYMSSKDSRTEGEKKSDNSRGISGGATQLPVDSTVQ